MTKEDKIILKTILKELKNQAPLSINDIFNKIKNIKQVKKHFPDLDVVEVIKYVVQLETCEQVTKFEIKINDIQEYVLTNKCRYSEIDELYQSKFTKWLKKPGFSIPVGLSFLFSIINLIISINTCNKETTIEKITDKKKEIPFTNHEIDSIIDTRFNVLTKITN